MKTNILLCEDDVNLASVMADYLREHDYAVTHVHNGQEGLEAVAMTSFDICLTDIMMPIRTGLEMITELRESGNTMPIIILSQRGTKEDIIQGYKAGCDDYIVKPQSMDVIICKIEAIMRRVRIEEDNNETIYQLGDLTFDSIKQVLGQTHLSGRENDLLLMLCRKSNRLVERSQILKSLWHADNYFASRSLSVYINHLRKLLKNAQNVQIVAIHGKGYKIIIG